LRIIAIFLIFHAKPSILDDTSDNSKRASRMSASMYVNGALVGMLIDYLAAKQVDAPVFQATLVELQTQERIAIQTWIGLLDEVARLTPIPAVGTYQSLTDRHRGIFRLVLW
jgi:hypothetical protein